MFSVHAQIIGADESIPSVEKHTDASPTGKGGIDAGDSLLLSQETEVIGVFQEHFHQVSSGAAAALQQGLKGGTPGLGKGFSQ